jgi:hypothetical protein
MPDFRFRQGMGDYHSKRASTALGPLPTVGSSMMRGARTPVRQRPLPCFPPRSRLVVCRAFRWSPWRLVRLSWTGRRWIARDWGCRWAGVARNPVSIRICGGGGAGVRREECHGLPYYRRGASDRPGWEDVHGQKELRLDLQQEHKRAGVQYEQCGRNYADHRPNGLRSAEACSVGGLPIL